MTPSPSDRPRNRHAVARAARTRELIRQLLLEHAERCPLARPLTIKAIQELLRQRGINLQKSAVAWHMTYVRLQADIEALDVELKGRNPSNLSDTTRAL
ncbi:MAG: hypothetical protein M0038_04925 [Pseudomonadota bacterium]|jgi:hypothetical protein|nr:hypothetical protein [Pseudomonadota bacterium]